MEGFVRNIGVESIDSVIASAAKQSRATLGVLDCFVAALLAMTEEPYLRNTAIVRFANINRSAMTETK